MASVNVHSYSYKFIASKEFSRCYMFSVKNIDAEIGSNGNTYIYGDLLVNRKNAQYCQINMAKLKIKDIKNNITLRDTFLSGLPDNKGEKKVASFSAYLPKGTFNNSSNIEFIIN